MNPPTTISLTPWKIDIEPKNHPNLKREHHLPNLHVWGFQPLIFHAAKNAKKR